MFGYMVAYSAHFVHYVDIMNSSESPMQGAKLVRKVAAILRFVSSTMPEGQATTNIANATGLSRPTTHRILTSLAAEGFVDHSASEGRWHLGPEVYLMGSVAAERYEVSPAARESVRELAAATGESAFLSVRRGEETVCLVREEGSFPIRSHVLSEGVRFPLGVASAGLAILSFLPEAQIDRFLASNDLSTSYGAAHGESAIRERILATRRTGYAVNPGLIVEGSWGMGAAVFDASNRPAWALSLTGVESRFAAARQPELGHLLLKQAHKLGRQLSSQPRLV